MTRSFANVIRTARMNHKRSSMPVWPRLLTLGVMLGVPASRAGAAPPDERTRPVSSDPLPFGMSQGVQYLDLIERYLTLMEKFARLTEDPAASGAAAALSAKDILMSDGDAGRAIDYFIQVLPEVKNESVQRTIRIELADLYKHAGQKDKALEQLRILMISAPPESSLHRDAHPPMTDASPPR